MNKKIITIKSTDSIRTAYQLMQEHRIRHLPVVDDKGVVGILSDRDLQRAMAPRRSIDMTDDSSIEFNPEFQAMHFMSWPAKTLTDTTPIREATREMVQDKISAFVIVGQHERLKGIMTSHDLLKYLLHLLEKNPAGPNPSLSLVLEQLENKDYS